MLPQHGAQWETVVFQLGFLPFYRGIHFACVSFITYHLLSMYWCYNPLSMIFINYISELGIRSILVVHLIFSSGKSPQNLATSRRMQWWLSAG